MSFQLLNQLGKKNRPKVFSALKSRGSEAVLAGDGRCNSPGHRGKYCTDTFLDVESQKVVDFKVLCVKEVANSNQMEKKGIHGYLGTC